MLFNNILKFKKDIISYEILVLVYNVYNVFSFPRSV